MSDDGVDDVDVKTKILSHGVFLHKKLKEKNESEKYEIYQYKVELQCLQTIEFIADFNGSKNIELLQQEGLIQTTSIFPFQTKIVAQLKLFENWSLQQKFKVNQKPTSQDLQRKFVADDISKLNSNMREFFQLVGDKTPFSYISLGQVKSLLKNSDSTFIDKEFPPNELSIFGQQADRSNFQTIEQWRRPIEFMADELTDTNQLPQIFYENIEPQDIKECQLGDGWFLSALCILAERPGLIERLFVSQDYSQEGIYRVRLCKGGEWVIVTIDDYFPCAAMGGPIFSRPNDVELFVLILQKAYAKLHGYYFLLRGGFAHEALMDLTGCPTVYYDFDDPGVQKLVDQGALWNTIEVQHSLGYILSLSTQGEEKWGDEGIIDPEQSIEGLLDGHSYAVVDVIVNAGIKLLQLRNAMDENFQWFGDYSKNSEKWTDQLKDFIKPDFSHGLFYITYQEAIDNFAAMNVCQTRNWEEIRIKGKYVKIQDIDNPNQQVVQSKWYYSVEIKEKTRLVATVHQEDDRILSVHTRRPYIDIGLAILKRKDDGNVELVDLKDYHFDRQVSIETELEEGSYIILPRTTGCTLRNLEKTGEEIEIYDLKLGILYDEVEWLIKDIFRKFDMTNRNILEFYEFEQFQETIDLDINEDQFQEQVLDKFNSTDTGLTLLGFIDYFKHSIEQLDREVIWEWFKKLGYDRELHSIRSRVFMLSIHTSVPVGVVVRDSLVTDLDMKINAMVVDKYGKEMEVSKGVRAWYSFSPNVHAYTYCVLNTQNCDVEITLDCSQSENMIFSTQTPIAKKVVEPNVMTFMLHAEALPTAENFLRSAKCIWVAVQQQ